MIMKFEVGQRVIAVEEAPQLSIGDQGVVTSILGSHITVKLDNSIEELCWYPSRFQALDEYSMDYTTAFKVLIDGKMVEDEHGCILRFNKVDMRFQCRTETGNFINVDTVPSNVKFKEYVATPKFKRGDFVECQGSYYRVSNVIKEGNDYFYKITGRTMSHSKSDGTKVGEEEFREVQ